MENENKEYSKYKLVDLLLGLVSLVLLSVSCVINKLNPFGIINSLKRSENIIPSIIVLIFVLYFLFLLVLLTLYLILYIKNKKLNSPLNEFVSGAYIIPFFTAILLLLGTIFSTFTVSGTSMEQTYFDGDKLLTVASFDYDKDDIVYFSVSEEKFLIKRIVAKEGDTITVLSTGEVYVNNELIEGSSRFNSAVYNNYTLKKDEYYCMGDNRLVSNDSRYYGIIEEKNIYGKVILNLSWKK